MADLGCRPETYICLMLMIQFVLSCVLAAENETGGVIRTPQSDDGTGQGRSQTAGEKQRQTASAAMRTGHHGESITARVFNTNPFRTPSLELHVFSLSLGEIGCSGQEIKVMEEGRTEREVAQFAQAPQSPGVVSAPRTATSLTEEPLLKS
ncbi:hypothetical protein XENOCAPTIV_008324 [Xenoophorus captivus]|uniref:Uncharacterized protein n=1 Tax=Xenoophorus captivus TaxID=1517983 RepID=A0ABV0SBS2_9TELE